MLNKITQIRYYMGSLCIYDFWKDGIYSSLYSLIKAVDCEDVLRCYSSFYKMLCENISLKSHISGCVLTNDNIFTRLACCDEKISADILTGVKSDLKMLEAIASISSKDIIDAVTDENIKELLGKLPQWTCGEPNEILQCDWSGRIEVLIEYHKQNGYGKYAKHIAFTWRKGELCPVTSIDPITLDDLKNYENQRQRVIDNTESFVTGHPANNVLLYGDRGTGKSSTVHALLNEYHSQGLRMIEIPKSAVRDLSLIREAVADSPMKFIIYIDDLSFDSNDNSFSELKAALEGSLSGKQSNIIIYATSNRRHLIRESFSDRENDINKNDIMQEQLSLSDRFGLTITFLNPNKAEYLDIVRKIAADRGLEVDDEKLCFKADQWATRRGGRSPRCAKQFIDFVQSCVRRNKEW